MKEAKQEYQAVAVARLPITLAQFLKWNALVTTGGEGKEWVREGFILLNGEPCFSPGKQLQKGDCLQISLPDEEGTILCYKITEAE